VAALTQIDLLTIIAMKSPLHFKFTIKFAAAVFLCGVTTGDVFSQSTFYFFNYVSSAGVDAPVFDANGNRLAGTNYVAVLYGGVQPNDLRLARDSVLSVEMSPVPFTYMPNNRPGYFADSGYVQIDSGQCGGYVWLQVRAWDKRLGVTYDEVARLGLGGYGESPLFYTFGGDGCSATGLIPQPIRGLQSFSLVPEPSTWALVSLGVGWLFWRQRKRTESKV